MRKECCNIAVAILSTVQTFPSTLSLAFFPQVCFKLSFYVTIFLIVSMPSLMFVSFKNPILFLWVCVSRFKKPMMFRLWVCVCVPLRCHCLHFVCLSSKTMSTPSPTLYDLSQWQQGSQLILVHRSYFLHTIFNHWIGMLILDCYAGKCLFSYFTKKTVTSIGIEVEISVIPLVLLEPSARLKKTPISKITSDLVGYNYDATMKSTSILSTLLYSSLPCVLNSNANPEWVCVLHGSKGNTTKWGIIRQ